MINEAKIIDPSQDKLAPLVYVLILNWKSAQDTIDCVQSVKKTDYPNYKILLIDNHSPDNSGRAVNECYPGIEFIQTGKNLGYAGGNNIGIRHACQQGAKYVWILNPDVRTSADTLKVLVSEMEKHNTIGILGPKIETGIVDKSITLGSTFGNYPEYENSKKRWNDPIDKNHHSDYVLGCSMLIRVALLISIGLFREDFFLYAEEADLCLRARSFGWDVCVNETVMDRHIWSMGKKNKRDHFFYKRNRVTIARIHRGNMYKAFYIESGCRRLVCAIQTKNIKNILRALAKISIIPPFLGLTRPIQNIPKL